MLAAQRHSAILDTVRQRGGVRVADLVEQFQVSDMTIRRDLEALDRRGLLTKVHGGATVLSPAPPTSRDSSPSRRGSSPRSR